MKTVERIRIAQPMLGDDERKGVLAVLESGNLVQGRVVAELEAAFAQWCGVKHAVAVSSGTAGLHVALMAHGIKAGDEVITSPFTFIASANAALFVEARPVFCDIDPTTFCLSPEQVEAAITPRTRAIMPVHLYGYPAAMQDLLAIARRHDLVVIEDACQAHGASINGRKVGGLGASAVFSLYPSKNMIAGEGGLITTNDDAVAGLARRLRSHGASATYEARHARLQLPAFGAACGDRREPAAPAERLQRGAPAQRRHVDEGPRRRAGHRHAVGAARLPARVSPVHAPGPVRARRAAEEARRDGDRSPAVYYPIPVHKQPMYRDLGYRDQLRSRSG